MSSEQYVDFELCKDNLVKFDKKGWEFKSVLVPTDTIYSKW